jgi:hypothetical protein
MARRSDPLPSRSGARERDELRALREEIHDLRRADSRRPPQRSPRRAPRRSPQPSPRRSPRRRVYRRRRRVLAAAVIAVVAVVVVSRSSGTSGSYQLPSRASLAGLSVRARIVAIADSQLGYRTSPSHSYCNKFSAYWNAGTPDCPSGETSEEWCADFAAWAWRNAGIAVTYGYAPGELNGRAASFYAWGAATGRWHPVTSGYVARPGDVAVYGLSLGVDPTAAHVAIVTSDSRGQRGPDVVNGDGDRTGFSVVETGTDQLRADTGHGAGAVLAGYVSP